MRQKPVQQSDVIALPRKVRQFIVENHLILPGTQVVAAVSGGADSLAMLLLLERLQRPLAFSLRCVHVDHGLRGLESEADRDFVTNWCQKLNIPLTIERFNVKKQAEERRMGIEQVARELRQQVFQKIITELSRNHQPVSIALAHHQDDQAETLLMHLGRGSGLDGLSGMKAKEGSIIRPLLSCRRMELENWLRSIEVTWRHDPSNDSDFTIRNRLRHHLLPAWETLLGYDPVPLLDRTADNLSSDRQLIQHIANESLERCLVNQQLNLGRFLDLHPALQARVIQKYWHSCTGHGQNLEQKHIAKICQWAPKAQKWQSLDLPDHWKLSSTGQTLKLEQSTLHPVTTDALSFWVPLQVPGETRICPISKTVEARWMPCEQQADDDQSIVMLRGDQVRQYIFRTRRPGDRIHPAGQKQVLSLKKWMYQMNLSPVARDQLFVLADGSDIVWIPGYTVGIDYAAPTDNQPENLCIRLRILSDCD